jgi:DNA-binding SARP family transcriptional activator
VRFLMLGPMDVVDDGGQPVRAAKHRSLLAVLLVNANRVVPLGALIDELWQEAPPTACNLVRQYVSQLRKLLAGGRDSGVELQTHAAGYALVLPPQATDIQEFEQLVDRARKQLRAEEPLLARKSMDQAMRLWRGGAFADVAGGPRIAAEQARLEELRVTAEELRAEAGIAAGCLAEAVSELTALTVQYPLRERMHGQLMRALSASGRKADALAAYRSARQRLIAEIGLEPGQELRALEQAIIDDDDAPAAAGAVPAPTRTMPPLEPGSTPAAMAGRGHVLPQLPPLLGCFVGRQDEAAVVRGLLSQAPATGADRPGNGTPPVVVLCGVGGVGKTALALHIGHALQDDFPDGQVFLQLRTADGQLVDPVEALGQAMEILGRPTTEQPSGLLSRQHLYRTMLADKRILLVLDDAVGEAQVRHLIPGRCSGAVLVTSRSRLAALEGARQVVPPMFNRTEAAQLLASVIGSDRVAAEPEAARAIGTVCDGLPLAIRAAAAVLGQMPHRRLEHLVKRLDGDRIFDELVVGDLDLGKVMADTFAQLDQDEQQLLRQLAPTPGRSGNEEPDSLIREEDLGAPADAVDRLVAAGVLEFAGTDPKGSAVFRCARLLQQFAQRQIDGAAALVPLGRLRRSPSLTQGLVARLPFPAQ